MSSNQLGKFYTSKVKLRNQEFYNINDIILYYYLYTDLHNQNMNN